MWKLAAIITVITVCFFAGTHCGYTPQEVKVFMQSDVYKAQKALHESKF